MFKKFIAYLLTVSVLLSMLVVNVSAADEEISAERVTKFENAVTFLTKIGVIAKDEYEFDSGITKGKFVDIMSKVVPVSSGSLVPAFADVPATHEYFSIIQGFADAGYIDGHAGSFEPDRDITYNEALYITLNTMGYKDFMALVGAFPTGGWHIADRLNFNMKNKGAVAGDIFYMLYQALTTDMLTITGMKKDEFTFSNKNSETLLEKYLEIGATEGILQSNGEISLVGGKAPQDGVIIVDGVAYDTEEPCDILAGCLVDVFYDLETNDLVGVLASNKNKIVEIDSADIDYYKDRKYSYKLDGSNKTLKFQDVTDVVVNNILVSEINADEMIPANGKVIAIDNGNGSGYDVLYVKDYMSFLVRSVENDNNKTFTIKAETRYSLPTVVANLENNVPSVYDAEGNRIAVEDIAIGTVVSVMGNLDGKNFIAEEIVTSKDIVTGTLTTIRHGEPAYLVIDDEEYTVAESIKNEFLRTLSPQMDMTFFVDFMGNIVALDDAVSGSMAYGYILGAKPGVNDDGDPCIIAEIFSEIGSIIKYKVSPKRLFVDGVPSSKDYAYDSGLPDSEFDKYLKMFQDNANKLIRYDVNNDRELNKVDFPKSIKDGTAPNVDDRLYWSLDNFNGQKAEFTQFYGSKKAFGDKVHVDEDTIFFKLPSVARDELDNDYKVIRSISGLKDGRYGIVAYKLGTDMMYAKVVVLKELLDPTLSANHKGNVMVTKVTEVLNEYQEPAYEITFLGMDGEKTYITKTKDVGDKPVKLVSNNTAGQEMSRTVAPGDIVRYYLTEDETSIAKIVICYDIVKDEATDGGGETTSWAEEEGTYKIGYVYALDDKRVAIASGEVPETNKILDDSEYSTYMVDAFKIFKVEVTGTKGKDRRATEITQVTKNELTSFKLNGKTCSRVLAISSRGTGQLMFVFPNESK